MTVSNLYHNHEHAPLDRPDIMGQLLAFHQSAELANNLPTIQDLYFQHLKRGVELFCPGLIIEVCLKPNLNLLKTAAPLQALLDESGHTGSPILKIVGGEDKTTALEITLIDSPAPSSALLAFAELLTEQLRLFLRAQQYLELVSEAELTDSLTSLPNRRAFEAELRTRCNGLNRFALLLANLDRFSRINDVMGPEAGDEVLIRVAGRLSELLSPADFLARIHGDEFAILIDGANEEAALMLAARVHEALSPGLTIAERSIRCFASVGITLCPDSSLRPSELLRGARISMADAKRGQLGTLVHNGDSRTDFSEQLLIESHLEEAIQQDQFELAAQPIFDVQSGQIKELEILLRWNLPGHGPVSPERFISVAEDIGLSEKLDRYVMSRAMRMTEGVNMPVSVNLAAPTLYSPSFIAFVEALLDQYQRSAGMLGIEITERIIARPDAARETVDALGRMGVHIAIDDFGIGYSSLGVLPELPISRLKIDKKFLLGKDENPRYEEVIVGMLRMASALGMESLVEGVEDEALVYWLGQVGCDFAQGFGLARPEPLAQIVEKLVGAVADGHHGPMV